MLLLAEETSFPPFFLFHGRNPVCLRRLFLPCPPSDYVCQLYAFSAFGITRHRSASGKKEAWAFGLSIGDGLPAQLLLCPGSPGSFAAVSHSLYVFYAGKICPFKPLASLFLFCWNFHRNCRSFAAAYGTGFAFHQKRRRNCPGHSGDIIS